MPRVLGIIPARAGSKGVKNKNMRKIGGKSLVQRAIESASESKLISRVILSTDSMDIADEARQLGCDVPFLRPSNLADDNASSHNVVLHALEVAETEEDSLYDLVVLLQPTTPFRKWQWIDACINRVARGDVDSATTVINVGGNHPHRMYSINKPSDTLKPLVENVKHPMAPRQSLPDVYIRSGDVYASTRECITSKMSLLGELTAGIEIASTESVNIDTYQDLLLARIMSENLGL